MGLRTIPFNPPSWAKTLLVPTHGRLPIARLPTPVIPWNCGELSDLGVEWWIKRDDLTGNELSGNKARKLELLMAEALGLGCDTVVTIGGVQSNHCRATAAAARLAGLEPHVVLLVRDRAINEEVGLGGNLLVERMLGTKLHLCAAKHYVKNGGDLAAMDKLNEAAAAKLRKQGKRPFVIPVGGTCPTGTWGYLHAVEELRRQQQSPPPSSTADSSAVPSSFDHIVVACGSGGTAAGLALGMRMSGMSVNTALHAVNVQHTPSSFYNLIDNEARAMGVTEADHASLGPSTEWLNIIDGGRLGYGNTDKEELQSILRVASSSGVLLDHTYTGKALHHFCAHARAHPETFRGSKVLFWHTGGLPGLAAQEAELLKDGSGLVEKPERLEL